MLERRTANGRPGKKNVTNDKVRLTKNDIGNGNVERATKRMNDRDGGLAKHATICQHEIDWEGSKIINKEENWTQRKMLEGIETLRQKSKGKPFRKCLMILGSKTEGRSRDSRRRMWRRRG